MLDDFLDLELLELPLELADLVVDLDLVGGVLLGFRLDLLLRLGAVLGELGLTLVELGVFLRDVLVEPPDLLLESRPGLLLLLGDLRGDLLAVLALQLGDGELDLELLHQILVVVGPGDRGVDERLEGAHEGGLLADAVELVRVLLLHPLDLLPLQGRRQRIAVERLDAPVLVLPLLADFRRLGGVERALLADGEARGLVGLDDQVLGLVRQLGEPLGLLSDLRRAALRVLVVRPEDAGRHRDDEREYDQDDDEDHGDSRVPSPEAHHKWLSVWERVRPHSMGPHSPVKE